MTTTTLKVMLTMGLMSFCFDHLHLTIKLLLPLWSLQNHMTKEVLQEFAKTVVDR